MVEYVFEGMDCYYLHIRGSHWCTGYGGMNGMESMQQFIIKRRRCSWKGMVAKTNSIHDADCICMPVEDTVTPIVV